MPNRAAPGLDPNLLNTVKRAARRSARRAHAAPPLSRFDPAAMQRLLPVPVAQLDATSPAILRGLIARLHTALRYERRQGRAGHWSYDLNRHVALHQMLEILVRRLRSNP